MGSPALILNLDALPQPHAFTNLPLESGFSMYKILTTLKFVFSSNYFISLTYIVFTKAFFKYCFKRFITIKTVIFICISLSFSFILKYLFIKYGIDRPLFESPVLYYSYIAVSSLSLRYIKECFEVI